MKLRIHAIDQLEKTFMAKNTAMSSVANSIKKLYIQIDLHLIYKQSFYRDKQDEMNELLDEYHLPLLKDIDHTASIEEWKRNIDAADYENN